MNFKRYDLSHYPIYRLDPNWRDVVIVNNMTSLSANQRGRSVTGSAGLGQAVAGAWQVPAAC